MGLLAWIVIGVVAGGIAKALMPGRDPGGVVLTTLLGIVGAVLGGWVGNAVVGRGLEGFGFWSLVLAIGGAMLLLFVYRVATGRRRASV